MLKKPQQTDFEFSLRVYYSKWSCKLTKLEIKYINVEYDSLKCKILKAMQIKNIALHLIAYKFW